MKDKIYYSINEEEFNYDCEREAIEEAIESAYPDEIAEATIWKGTAVETTYSDLFSLEWLAEDIEQRAYDNFGEHAEDFSLDLSDEQGAELEMIVCDWLNKNAAKLRFYRVSNVEKITVPLPYNP